MHNECYRLLLTFTERQLMNHFIHTSNAPFIDFKKLFYYLISTLDKSRSSTKHLRSDFILFPENIRIKHMLDF